MRFIKESNYEIKSDVGFENFKARYSQGAAYCVSFLNKWHISQIVKTYVLQFSEILTCFQVGKGWMGTFVRLCIYNSACISLR